MTASKIWWTRQTPVAQGFKITWPPLDRMRHTESKPHFFYSKKWWTLHYICDVPLPGSWRAGYVLSSPHPAISPTLFLLEIFLTSCLAVDEDSKLLSDHTPVLNVASILKLFDWRIITHCLPAVPCFPFLSPPNWNPIPLKNLSKLKEITEDSHLAVKLDRIQLTVGCGICNQNLRVSVLYHWAPQLMAFGTCCQKWMELSGIHLVLSRTKLQFKSIINHFISHSGFLHVVIKI